MMSALNGIRGAALAAPWSIAVGLLCLLVFLLAGPAPPAWLLQRGTDAPVTLLTAHLTHSDAGHLFWNLFGLAVLGYCFEPLLRGHTGPLLLVAALAVSGWFLLVQTTFSQYCGLSSMLNALLAAGLLAWWRRSGDYLAPLLAAGALLKIGVEVGLGDGLLSAGRWPSTPIGHLVGFVTGMAYMLTVGAVERGRRNAHR